MLKDGLYEQVINESLQKDIDESVDKFSEIKEIDKAESSKILSQYITDIIEKGLNYISDDNLSDRVSLINKIVSVIKEETEDEDFDSFSVNSKAEQLLSVFDKKNSVKSINNKVKTIRPETSIAQSSLFTGAVHEPQMYTELKKEIVSSDRIDMLVSFVKWSGLRLIINELREFTQNGGELRIITTSYMGATDVKAIEELRKLPNTKIKVSYDTKVTRLHAKAYVFYRDTGFTTAYVGSSNLSNAAISSGLEWNVKVTKKDLPETILKIEATFESYWNSKEFEYYAESQKERLSRALRAEKHFDNNIESQSYTLDILPYSYQQEILDKLQAEREDKGYYRNLVVAATGTGKTVISAFDYRNFRRNNKGKPCRLLFVAHREEILKQSLYTFRAVLKDANFGELFVGKNKPDSIDNLFISIQTFNSQKFNEVTTEDFYDYIIVDEFHHAAAKTYQKLLDYYKPTILLGLTATPERMDGKSILSYFDNRIAAEIRLPEAIDRKLLCPFQYFGVTDNVDLDSLKWSVGGYDKKELSNIYTFSGAVANRRADLVVNSLIKYVTDINEVKGLGFCVSIEHAEFMSDYFNKCGISSIFLTGKSSDEERNSAKDKLVNGDVKFIFVVDIYNEGVDIPEVNTVLFLRPTESLTVFLQQLGRGLRLSEDKECLTVLDFIGQANKKYNFEDKFSALLSNTTRGITREIKDGFVSVPKGCYIQLERKAEKYILDNIRSSCGNTAGLVARIASFEEDTGKTLTLSNFLQHYRLDPRAVYKYSTFSGLCVKAGKLDNFSEPIEEVMSKAFVRFTSIDSRRWIKFLIDFLNNIDNIDFEKLSSVDKRMLQMFYITVWSKAIEDFSDEEVLSNLYSLSDSPIMKQELIELLGYKFNSIDFVDETIDLGFDSPLDVYCTYSQRQLLAGLDYLNFSAMRQGVIWLKDKGIDVFLVTLNKSDKDYSPTTMYNDYSINEELFHWQSQSTTSETSPTGQRYIHHKEKGSKILLFVREFKNDSFGNVSPYTFLGEATYVSHTGSKPMNITWRLEKPIPARFLKKTNKLVV